MRLNSNMMLKLTRVDCSGDLRSDVRDVWEAGCLGLHRMHGSPFRRSWFRGALVAEWRTSFDCECPFLPPEIERLRSVYPFRDWVRSSIHRLKYDGERARAPMLAEHVAHISDQLSDIDGIVPVPIHKSRLRARGFNQAELLATYISRTHGIPVLPVLERTTDRGSQVGRSGQDRWFAVDGAFTCSDPAAVRNRRLAVLDDVITTGATVSNCAIPLANAGASSVRAISIARG